MNDSKPNSGIISPAESGDMAHQASMNVAYNAAVKALGISMKAAASSDGQIVIATFPDGTIRVHMSEKIGVHHALAAIQTLCDMAGRMMVRHIQEQQQQLSALALELQRMKTGAAGNA